MTITILGITITLNISKATKVQTFTTDNIAVDTDMTNEVANTLLTSDLLNKARAARLAMNS